jgi:hypothetical protein
MEPGGQHPAVETRNGRAGTALALGVGLFLLYTANGRSIGAGDVVPATLQAVAFARGNGPVLDRFEWLLRTPAGAIPGYAARERGHVVSRYPIGPSVVALPFVAAQVAWLDVACPGWDAPGDRQRVRGVCLRLGKNAAAAIAALGVVAIWRLLHVLGLGRVACASALVIALGTGQWSTASQALWQHGPAALCLALALEHLARRPGRDRDLALAGFWAALMVACRPTDLPFALGIAGWVLSTRPRRGRWVFTLPAAGIAMALVAFNLWFFDHLTGGYAAIERMHPWAHGVRGSWKTPLPLGLAGTLWSPSHGLFVYAPWIIPVLLVLPWAGSSRGWWSRPGAWRVGAALPLGLIAGRIRGERRATREAGLVCWLLVALGGALVLLARYSCWWGGHCYGARFWIDAGPLLAVILAAALAWPGRRVGMLARGAMAAGLAWAIALQAVGFWCYPTSWHASPTNADRDHARLWDWSDNEVTRGLSEGVHPPAW